MAFSPGRATPAANVGSEPAIGIIHVSHLIVANPQDLERLIGFLATNRGDGLLLFSPAITQATVGHDKDFDINSRLNRGLYREPRADAQIVVVRRDE